MSLMYIFNYNPLGDCGYNHISNLIYIYLCNQWLSQLNFFNIS